MSTHELIVSLIKYGVDTESAIERFMGDSELYRSCLEAFFDDASIALLGEALMSNDCEKAFFAAHTLKGVAGNLGLNPIHETLVKIVEPLREGRCEGLEAEYEELLHELDALKRTVMQS